MIKFLNVLFKNNLIILIVLLKKKNTMTENLTWEAVALLTTTVFTIIVNTVNNKHELLIYKYVNFYMLLICLLFPLLKENQYNNTIREIS